MESFEVGVTEEEMAYEYEDDLELEEFEKYEEEFEEEESEKYEKEFEKYEKEFEKYEKEFEEEEESEDYEEEDGEEEGSWMRELEEIKKRGIRLPLRKFSKKVSEAVGYYYIRNKMVDCSETGLEAQQQQLNARLQRKLAAQERFRIKTEIEYVQNLCRLQRKVEQNQCELADTQKDLKDKEEEVLESKHELDIALRQMAELQGEVSALRQQLQQQQANKPWWRRVFDLFRRPKINRPTFLRSNKVSCL